MRSALGLVGLFHLSQLAAAQTYTLDPPTTAPADTIEDCTNWHVGAAGDTCEALAADYWIELSQLYRYNPSLQNGCNIIAGTSYCVEENWGIPPPPVTTTTTSTASPSGTAIPTPTPTMPGGMVQGCTEFYFVKSTDTCASVLTANSLTIGQLFALNAGVNADCSGLWREVYVCVSGPSSGGSTTTTTTTPTSSGVPTGPNGIATPTPTQPPSIVSNCNKFYFVESGTTCQTVLAVNGLTLDQLYAWNSGVNADCSGMWAGVHLCVGVVGGATTTTTTTTSSSSTTTPANGIVTPTPTQPPSIVANCNKFYFVESGTSCQTVLAVNGITIDQLFAWNSGVNSDCSGLWAGVHLCVGVIGGSPTTTTTTTTTTTPANGITTPTPTQPPSIVSNCNKFYFVPSGTTCQTVLSVNGLTIDQLYAWNSGVNADCSGMWSGVYLCVGVIGGGTTTPVTTTTTTTTPANGITTPTPIQPPSMVSNCNKFYYVFPGTTCDHVLSYNGINLLQLYVWNQGVGNDCSGMWANVWLCVGVVGGSTPTTTTTTTTTPANGIATPTPTQPGAIAPNCNRFYFVSPGTTCATVLSANGINLLQLYVWNEGVGNNCSGMWANVWLCVGVTA